MKDLYAGFMERLHWVPEPSSREFMFQLLPSIENMKLMLQFNAQILYIIAVEVSQKVSFLNGSAKKRNMICCKMYLRTRQQRSCSYCLLSLFNFAFFTPDTESNVIYSEFPGPSQGWPIFLTSKISVT